MTSPRKKDDSSRKYLVFAGMGMELVGLILGASWIGGILDKKYETKGLLVLIIVFACLAAWLYRIIWLLKRIEKREQEEERRG